ncbi:hypothetical protein EVAR_73566_1 [Eumeta japonica]|uniref:Uncharacterized protein n=1 Tax=Eumeta variegata TaxID=151549 RepID=A0A4C1SCI8_EUMVA|nr:hypothetical protein EVAR_73566_1 [Eumeta japonica]
MSFVRAQLTNSLSSKRAKRSITSKRIELRPDTNATPFDCADEGTMPSFHNLAPQYEGPLSGYQLPQDIISSPLKGDKAPTLAP